VSAAIVLFRRDLRLADNPALAAAADAHERVLPLYIHAPAEEAPWEAGAASRWWLHHSLRSLQEAFKSEGGKLHIVQGKTLPCLLTLIGETDADAVYWNRRYEPAAIACDSELKRGLRERDVQAHSLRGGLWCEPWEIETSAGDPYRVFTPFWRSLRPRIEEMSVVTPLPRVRCWLKPAGGLAPSALGLLPEIPWDDGLRGNWRPGEFGAHERLKDFCDDALGDYAENRDKPALGDTSRLSPHLHFGEITPRQIYATLRQRAEDQRRKPQPDPEPWLRQLAWREFGHHLLYHFPETPTENFNRRFDAFEWQPPDAETLERWRRGRTGIPLVDAGMRELWHRGWMHNRVRLVTGSLLTKNLGQHWIEGARWFWDTLVDADLANNTLGWQWVAGTGADAAPYFRIFNPLRQAQRFDPDARYIRHWVPELADLPTKLVHEPWEDDAARRKTGYPAPMLDLKATRGRALDTYKNLPEADR
jgi:deoxyribodipyrimidine photo-lyase